MATLATKNERPGARAPELLFASLRPLELLTRSAREVLAFAFARGTSEADLLGSFARRSLESTIDSKSIEQDLFIDELLKDGFPILVGERSYAPFRPALKRILLHPPSSLADVEFRQAIVWELSNNATLKEQTETAYEVLRELVRALFESPNFSSKGATLRRRLNILTSFLAAVRALAAIEGATSGLSRVGEFARSALESSAFERVRELLAFEESKTVIEARLKVGADGTLRHVEMVRSVELALPGTPRGPIGRFLRALWGMIQGHRFSEEEVLSQLVEGAFSAVEADIATLIDVYLSLEFYLGSLGFRARAERAGLPTSLARFSSERSYESLWNPWLLGAARTVTPTSMSFRGTSGTTILTGPNSGGKTRLLQSIAITQLLGQSGLFVPAARAELTLAPQMYFSLIERPSAEGDEGRLGTELRRVRQVFERCGPGSLVIMDELCSGTNPSEGEEIFVMVLELFEELRPVVFVSTHFLDFASRLEAARGSALDFYQVELGSDGLPTFRFIRGVATTSLASRTAERLGVTREELRRLSAERRLKGEHPEPD